ncbi:unnamed protein product [Symbiodinium sp. CCMP2592]|nr:unnamed protein product [Symbiodinium sp. CCMP2592]
MKITTLSRRQLQSDICYIQRSFNLSTGLKGEWTPQALETLNKWLSSPKKGTRSKAAAPHAILDGDVNDKPYTEEAKSENSIAENPDLEVEAKETQVGVEEAKDAEDLLTENPDLEVAKGAKDANDLLENPELELKGAENTQDTSRERGGHQGTRAGSDSDSSYSDSSSSSWIAYGLGHMNHRMA